MVKEHGAEEFEFHNTNPEFSERIILPIFLKGFLKQAAACV